MTRDGGQIEIRLFIRGGGENEYHVGDFGDAKCTIDLSEYSFFVFPDKKDPRYNTLILKQRKDKLALKKKR